MLYYHGALCSEKLMEISLHNEILEVNALQLAILFGHTVAIDYLFNIYKEPSSLYIMGSYTVLYLAVLANRPDSLKCLLEHPSIKARKHFGEKPDIHQETTFHLAKD